MPFRHRDRSFRTKPKIGHDRPEWAVTIKRNQRSRSSGMGGHDGAEYPEALSRLRADILVTHEGPSMHRFGFTAIDELASSMQVKKLFHGHQHEDIHYPKSSMPAASTLQAFGVGMRGVMDVEGTVLVPGLNDNQYRDGLL